MKLHGAMTKDIEEEVLAQVRFFKRRAEQPVSNQDMKEERLRSRTLAHAYRRLQASVLGVQPAALELPSPENLTRENERRILSDARDLRKRAGRDTGDVALKEARANVRKLAHAYRRLQAAALGVSPASIDLPDAETFSHVDERAGLRAIRSKAQALTLEGQLALGHSLEESTVALIRDQLKRGNHVHARSVAQGMRRDPRLREVGALAEALVAVRLNLYELAMARFSDVPIDVVLRLAAREYSVAAAHRSPAALHPLVDHLLATPAFDPAAATWVLKYLVGTRDPRCAELRDRLSTRDDLSESDAATLAWLDPWIDRIVEPTPAADVPAESVSFGIITYGAADRSRTSSNIGDFVQTIAASSHLVRRQGLSFAGDPELAEAFTELADRVRDDARIDGPERTVQLIEVARDASHLNPIPRNTWALAFGWYAHSPFDLLPDFPLHENVNPIFISFHVNRLEILTPAAIDYLREHAPIGCRDWNTVFLLRSAGVPAFFSGCMTTTTGSLFPDVPVDETKPVVYVDTAPPEDEPDALQITQAYEEVRDRSAAENIREAVRLIGAYQTDYSRVITSRLHCYLPSWSAGVNVEFRPHRRVDVRFNGLLDASEQERRAMRDRITRLLRPTLDAVIAGRSKEEVYEIWRRETAEELALAERVFAERHPLPSLPFDIDDGAALVSAESTHRPAPGDSIRTGGTVHVAIALDGNLKEQAKTVVAGLVDNTTRPIHLYVLCRDHDAQDKATLEQLFPEIAITWLPCDHLQYGTITGMLVHITVSTMDRLMLPYLVPASVGKILYHDIDALTVADIGELYDTELGDAPLAARDAPNWKVRLGMRTAWAATGKMTTDPEVANDYLLRVAQTAEFGFTSFNAGIMLLNLRVMRDDRFGEEFLPWATRYGLNDQQLLNVYANSRRVPFASSWNALPAQEEVASPSLIHWAGHAKPWMADYIVGKEHWQAAEQRVDARAVDAGLEVG